MFSWNRRNPAERQFSLEKEKLLAPQRLPSGLPMVLVFAATPMRPSFVKTVVEGAVLIRSSHLRPDATETMKEHANSLSVTHRLESETNSPMPLERGVGFVRLVFVDIGRCFPNLSLRYLSFGSPIRQDKVRSYFDEFSGRGDILI